MEQLTAKDLIQRPPVTAFTYESSKAAADRMASHSVGRLLVVDSQNNNLIGIVTRADLLKARSHQQKEEIERERIFTFPGRNP